MKSMKKLVSVVLALIMVMGMSSSVFAAEGAAAKYTITAPDNGHTYEVYQIFTGDFDNGVLSNVKWGKNGTGTEGEKVSSSILTELKGLAKTESYKEELAVITKYAKLTDPVAELNKDNLLTEVVGGYYLIKDKDGSVTGNDVYTTYIVAVAGDITITPKTGKPTVEKTVKDINDSTGATSWGETADYDIGDDVAFELKATLAANVESYDKYKIIFHDTLDAGLTYNKDAKVYFGDDDVTAFFTVDANGQVLTITCDDVTQAGFEAGNNSVITVKYTAELNEKAQIGQLGNKNTVKLEYSNNPNNSGESSKDTGTTLPDTVVVFTYKTVVNKVDEKDNELKGAGFTLYKKDASGNYNAVGEEVKGTDMTTFEWKGLDDGDYKLVETTTPAGYNTMEDVLFSITPEEDGKLSNVKLDNIAFTANDAYGSLTADVVNYPGSSLPSTGGMGTTILYLVGALLIIGAGTTLVMRRRRAEEN